MSFSELTIVIPVRNDAVALAALLPQLSSLGAELLVVDGASSDQSPIIAAANGCRVISSSPSRGLQLATGASQANGSWLWFLHADTVINSAVLDDLTQLIQDQRPCWGRFNVRLNGQHWLLWWVSWFMNKRSCLTGICTGDQGILVHRTLLNSIGGVPIQPLMEDIELSRRLRRLAKPRCMRSILSTSARQWQRRGIIRTIVRMWIFRARYFFGTDPEILHREYYAEKR